MEFFLFIIEHMHIKGMHVSFEKGKTHTLPPVLYLFFTLPPCTKKSAHYNPILLFTNTFALERKLLL